MSNRIQSYLFIMTSVALAASISMIGGYGIEKVSEELLLLTPLVIALPSLANLVGDYAAIIAAHVGDKTELKSTRKKLMRSVYTALSLSVSAIIILSLLLAYIRGFEIDTIFILKFAGFITVAASVIVFFMFSLAVLLEKILRKRHLNPDDLLTPIVTSLSDLAMLGMVTLAVLVLF